MKNQRLQFKILTIFSLLFFATPVYSAHLYFEKDISHGENPNQIILKLKIDPQGEEINAIQGGVVFPEDILSIKKINEGNSIINFWIENPLLTASSVIFAGITPNGFKGILSPISGEYTHGEIMTLIFEVKKKGEGVISLENVKVLKNDGEGSEATNDVSDFEFSVFPDNKQEKLYKNYDNENDIYPPESFDIYISNDPDIFGGKYFVVFDTKDKQSGIFLYKVKEGSDDFVVAKSPYLLKDQSLTKKIIVQAIDKNGNIREELLESQNINYLDFSWLLILFILVVISFYVKIKKR